MSIKYRPEIDGLRTIAVLSVIAYHAEFSLKSFQLLKGGFLGVDIFFVISGFLITSIIINEKQKTKTFSILKFYERRTRRLLPALFTVIFASLPVAWVILFPTQFVDFLKSIIASLFFGSNFYWHITLQEYGTESSLFKPFLHTWSLAVEEQFYILYPLIFLFFYKWFKQNIIFLFLVVFISSLIFAQYMTAKDTSFSFYLLPSRIWELISGCMLAILLTCFPTKSYNQITTSTFTTIGLFLILFSLFFIDFKSHHPGLITLIPVLGTILIIWFSDKNNLITKTLSSNVFVGIGLISYSLYLWHYPIFAFGRMIEHSPSIMDKAIWILLTFVLSIATYFYIEIPFRQKNTIAFRPLARTVTVCSLLIVSFSTYGVLNNGIKERHGDLVKIYGKNDFDNRALKTESWSILNNISKSKGFDRSYAGDPSDFEKSILWFSSNSSTKKVLILGDSHAKDLFNAFYQNANEFPKHEFARFGMNAKIPKDQIQKLISSPNFKASDIVLISFRYAKPTITNLQSLLDVIKTQNKTILIASNTAEFNIKENLPIYDWYMRNKEEQPITTDLNGLMYENIKSNLPKVNQAIVAIASRNSITYLDKFSLVCNIDKKECTGLTPNGYKPFYDYGHWTLEGAKHFGQKILASNWF